MVERISRAAIACGLLMITAGAASFAQDQAGQAQAGQTPQQKLTDRAAASNADTAVDTNVIGEMRMPIEASGHYDLGHGRDVMEVDFTPDGLAGYLSLYGSRVTGDAKAPLTFFFMQTRLDGDRLHFITHEIHRTWYEFDGVLKQTPPEDKTLNVTYALVGTLTTHRKDDQGSEQQKAKKVRFKKMRY